MKTNEIIMKVLLMILLMAFAGCGKGGTETGTSGLPYDVLTLGARVKNVASALVPDMNEASNTESLAASNTITYRSSDDWAAYLENNNVGYLTDIFGDPGVGLDSPTKIRVLLDDYRDKLEAIFSVDQNIDCTGGEVLDEGDDLQVAFYGLVSNGTAGDRYYNCIREQTDGYTYTALYGKDSSNVVRVIYLSDNVVANTNENVNGAGAYVREMRVMNSAYAEVKASDDDRTGYLDLQYATAVVYSGLDAEFGSSDDVIFKARSRITGEAGVDAEGIASFGDGDFTVTKYDYGLNNDSEWSTTSTKSVGRGSYVSGSFSLFNIDASPLEDVAGIYCIQNPTSGLPAYAEPANCVSLENAYSWTASSFPFTIDPEIEENFEDKPFFNDDDEDLISSDGENFIIPEYSTAHMPE